MSHLTKKNEDFCSIAGYIGLGLSITCLLQFFIFINGAHWIVYLIGASYIFSIICFLFLIKQKRQAPAMLIVNSITLLLAEILLLLSRTFSLIVLLLMLYSIIITVFVYINNLPEELKRQALDSKAEEIYWENKI